ncbi:MAG: DUF4825 domain-containing protein [Lachnospiraceae bacterium]|nr:DUF4825 domain-containing protein [Lachnospiraceae bacterium]
MKQIMCNVIRDLFPSYIDKLTSEDSDRLIEEHVAECEECAKILNDMRSQSNEPVPEPNEKEKKEIDFLKKNKRRNRRIMVYCIVGTILGIFLVLYIRAFGIGMQYLSSEYWVVEKMTVEDGVIHFKATSTDGLSSIKELYVEEDSDTVGGKGNVFIMPKIVLFNPLFSKNKEFTYELADPSAVKEIWFGTKLLWVEGEVIEDKTFELFNTRHLYIGNVSSNGKLARALGVTDIFGPYENQLETAEEPYGWTLRLQEKVTENQRAIKEGAMESTAYVFLALVNNLDHVTFEYATEEGNKTKIITAADASDFFGRNIKDCYENAKTLQALLRRLGQLQN